MLWQKENHKPQHIKKSFLKDFSWYFIGAVIPILIGIIKTPIFTRHFSKLDYGYLGLVLVSFSFLGMMLYSWINSCIWRYYPKYKEKNKLKRLYSNLFFLFVIATLILFFVCFFWYIYEANELVRKIIFLSFFNLIFSQLFFGYMVVLRLEGKAKLFTLIQSFRTLFSLVVVLFLVFKLNEDISALVTSLVLVDFFVVLFLLFFNPSKVGVRWALIRRKYLEELLVYGGAGLLLNVCFLIISSSDRYIIAWFGNVSEVGVYDQVYKLSQLTVISLVAVYFNTINPTLLHKLEANFNEAKSLVREYLKPMLLIGVPFVFYLSFFSKEIANIFLGLEFREGYIIMPYVFFASILHGVSNFYELRLKFANKLKKLSQIVVLVTIINIVLTTIFVWLYGYLWASITTLISYFVLVFLFHKSDKEILRINSSNRKSILFFITLLILQGLIYILLSSFVDFTFLTKIFLIISFIVVYIYIYRRRIKRIKFQIN